MATSNTMNFGPEWMRRFPKTPTSESNRSTSPTLSSSNVTTNSSTISASANINTNLTNNTNSNGTSTFSWSSVAAANSNNTTSNRSLHSEMSEKSEVPGAGESALNPFKYSKEFMLKLYKPVGLPLEFERHEYVTSEEALQPMAMIVLTEQEQKLLSGVSVNSELTRRIVSNASVGTVTGGERIERERIPFSPRGEKHISSGLTSPRSERFGGIIGGVLSGRTSPRSSRPPRSLNSTSVDDPGWNGVTRHAVGTFDNGVFRIPGNNVEDETLDKVKKEDTERGKKIEQELEKKNPTDRSDSNAYINSSQNEIVTSKSERKEMNNKSMNDIEDSTRHDFTEDLQENTLMQLGLKQETQQECQVQEDKVLLDWQGSQSHPNQETKESSLQQNQTESHQEEQNSFQHLQQRHEEEHQLSRQQGYCESKDDEKDIEQEFKHDNDHGLELERENEQLTLEQQNLILQRLQHQQELLQQQQHQQQQCQQQLLQHHQPLLLHHRFDLDQDDDVLKEAFAYSNLGGNTPPLSPTGKTSKFTSAHSNIGTSNVFGDSNSGVASLFAGTGINAEPRKVALEQCKWLYRDPSGNIQGPFSSLEMNEWYKGGFFVHSLLVKRVEDTTFEPLGVLIRKTGDDEKPFSAPLPGSRPPLTISMPNNPSRLVNDPFQRSWIAPNSPSTAQLFLDNNQQRFNPFGGTTSVPNTPFDRYQFGSVFGRNDVSSGGGWGELSSTNNNAWGQPDGFTSNNENLSPRVQAPNSPPLFNNNAASFNVSPPQNFLDHQRAHIERQQYVMLQQRQLQQSQHAYPDTFIRQQQQSYIGLSGPVSAPITNAPNPPFVDALTRSAGWPTTSVEQPTPLSPWGVPGVGSTSSRVPQSDEIGYFSMRKENNIGLQQSSHIDQISSRHNERQYEIMDGNGQDPSIDRKINDVVESMTKPLLGDEIPSKKVDEKVMSEQKVETPSKNITNEMPSHFIQKEESYRLKPSLREIQAEEEQRKKKQEKEKLASIAQQTSNQIIVKNPQPPKNNGLTWGNNSPVTPSSAPWAKDDDHSTHKTPSLREIQEMEARKSAERKAAASTVTTHSTVMISKEESTPSNSSWGIIGQNSSNTSSSSSLSTSPVVTTLAWQSNNSAPKKTLREIQKEEEEAMKRRNRIREMQQQALIGSNSGAGSAATNSMGKRYADTVATGNGAKKPGSISMNTAWTTVASKSSNRAITAVSPQPNNATINVISKPSGKDSAIAWDMDSHKATSVNLNLSKTSGNGSVINANNSNEHFTPRSPSEEFLKWCRQTLRGLNDVNVEDFIQMLLTFPLDPPSATIEIIQDSIYANSSILDGRRFADEFVKRRKADASGKEKTLRTT
ncbi:14834_t:CDS:10 [Funneliformis geosporum]|uniref:14834_t:CDS:1 n=1 Tax=Funneliformis geosporum TaxID=1117311 RepID=A0A9W4SHH6_9GLOM|nr:14834_t:CDS:10 [Funneliformis geosporum]